MKNQVRMETGCGLTEKRNEMKSYLIIQGESSQPGIKVDIHYN